ncbi:MFS transporter [Candidatus Woesearchaeota archaeon]|nr:MFS transporter [Candidatus Woesearchaeota archaeon]
MRLFPIFLVVFIDLLGLGILIPVMAPLIMDPHGILPSAINSRERAEILGLLLGSFAIAQFFGSPILGALSDRIGRKKVLAISIAGTMIGYMIFGLGIVTANIWLLFISRLLAGFAGGNIAVAMSAIADVSDEKSKSKNFGLVGVAFGLGFIIGPFIGGKLSDPSILPWFNNATPFWFAAALSAVNMALVMLVFQETLKVKVHRKISPTTGIMNVVKALSMPNVRMMFLVSFAYFFGFTFYTQFFQVYLYERFSFTQSQIGDIFAYLGLWVILTQGLLIRFISSWMSPRKVLYFSILSLSLSLLLVLVPRNPAILYLILPIVSVSNGITMPNMSAIISDLAGRESQGEIMGISGSLQSLAFAIPPIISGFVYTVHFTLPVILGSFFVFTSWILYLLFSRQKETKFHEL